MILKVTSIYSRAIISKLNGLHNIEKRERMNMEMNQKEKKKLIIYIVIAYGITYLMGVLMWYGYTKGYDLGLFGTTQMMYPAAGIILALLVTNKGEKKLPVGFYAVTLIITIACLVLAIMSVVNPCDNFELYGGITIPIYEAISQYCLIFGGIAALICLAIAGKAKRKNAGLSWHNWKQTILVIVVFIAIYFGRTVASTIISGFTEGVGLQYFKEWLQIFKNPYIWVSIITLPINAILVFLPFFGEEYGWRYYLQPVLQKKFGMRAGVIVLGIVWGLWHAPLDFFFYTTTTGVQMLISQIITCVFIGIFFAYAYMKTQNIWSVVFLHFLNNNLIPIITGTLSADVIENQVIAWSDIPVLFVLNGLCFGFFLLADVFKKKEDEQVSNSTAA